MVASRSQAPYGYFFGAAEAAGFAEPGARADAEGPVAGALLEAFALAAGAGSGDLTVTAGVRNGAGRRTLERGAAVLWSLAAS